MHHEKVIVDDKFNITNRGPVLMVDFDKNARGLILFIGDTLEYDKIRYTIESIESVCTNGDKPAMLGLIVKETEK